MSSNKYVWWGGIWKQFCLYMLREIAPHHHRTADTCSYFVRYLSISADWKPPLLDSARQENKDGHRGPNLAHRKKLNSLWHFCFLFFFCRTVKTDVKKTKIARLYWALLAFIWRVCFLEAKNKQIVTLRCPIPKTDVWEQITKTHFRRSRTDLMQSLIGFKPHRSKQEKLIIC